MKIAAIFFSLSVLVFACRPAKKVQKIQNAISKVDTTGLVIRPKDNNKVDSTRLIRDVYKKVLKNKIEFKTFAAKVKVDYTGKDGSSEPVTAYIRLEKDKALWLSLRGALGIEGFRVMVTRDSVKVMNLLKKTIQYRSIEYLKDVTELPFDFTTLQDIIIGNPVFIDSNIVSYKTNANNEFLVLMVGKLFKHLVTLDNKDFKLLHSKLDDIDVVRNRTCDITFSDYEEGAGVPFATKRKISVAEKSKLDISLDFKQYTFNQPTTFPFSIPKNYKRI